MIRKAIQIVDLGFGDSGKGTMVDYLCRRHEADLVVRFNGGPQAGHNVVLPDGRHHTFAQFGSGSFLPGLRTLLSRFMLIEPYAMLNEAAHLDSLGCTDILSRTIIDERCTIITPLHQVRNRIRERARGDGIHGSCGIGFGECVADSIKYPELCLHAADLSDRGTTKKKLHLLVDFTRAKMAPLREFAESDELRILDDVSWIQTAAEVYARVAADSQIVSAAGAEVLLRDCHTIIFEGAQGVLLDERYGFHPHITWSKTTFTNADLLLDEAEALTSRERIGVIRSYLTRHGAGPFLPFAEDLQARLPEPHNSDSGWQGRFRCGPLDLVLLRYAIDACRGIDGLAITHLDKLSILPPHVCDGYEFDGVLREKIVLNDDQAAASTGRELINSSNPRYRQLPFGDEHAWTAVIQELLHTPVRYRSTGPTFRDKQ